MTLALSKLLKARKRSLELVGIIVGITRHGQELLVGGALIGIETGAVRTRIATGAQKLAYFGAMGAHAIAYDVDGHIWSAGQLTHTLNRTLCIGVGVDCLQSAIPIGHWGYHIVEFVDELPGSLGNCRRLIERAVDTGNKLIIGSQDL